MKNKVLAILILTLVSLLAYPSGASQSKSMEMTAESVVTPLLQYQGRLTNPRTGEPIPDGSYIIITELFTTELDGTAVWGEKNAVAVKGGLFSTVLGDTEPMKSSLFDGRALWLEISVEGVVLTPRQPIVPVAYAIGLVPGAVVTSSSGPALTLNNTLSGEALRVGGNLNVSGSLIGGKHVHSAGDITGGTMTGALTVPDLLFSSAQTRNFMIGSEGFLPSTSGLLYRNSVPEQGAYILTNSGYTSGALVAPVHLPQGAVISSFVVYYIDNDPDYDLDIYLQSKSTKYGLYTTLAEIHSSANPGYSYGSTRASAEVDNRSYSYLVKAETKAWGPSGYLQIIAALVTYTVSEAQ